jgi:thiamine-phosphate pyrophosphorylase
MKTAFIRPCLMLVTDRKLCREPFLEIIEQAVEGGVDIIQLREKDLQPKPLLRLAESIREITKGRTRLIINGDAHIALACGADGVHLPEAGPTVEEARTIVGDQVLVGKSVHSTAGAIKAQISGADYLVLGTIYDTASKPGIKAGGRALIADAAGAIRIPILAIGGLTKERVPEALTAGAAGIAVCSAILRAENPLSACRDLRSALDRLPSPERGERDYAQGSNFR